MAYFAWACPREHPDHQKRQHPRQAALPPQARATHRTRTPPTQAPPPVSGPPPGAARHGPAGCAGYLTMPGSARLSLSSTTWISLTSDVRSSSSSWEVHRTVADLADRVQAAGQIALGELPARGTPHVRPLQQPDVVDEVEPVAARLRDPRLVPRLPVLPVVFLDLPKGRGKRATQPQLHLLQQRERPQLELEPVGEVVAGDDAGRVPSRFSTKT